MTIQEMDEVRRIRENQLWSRFLRVIFALLLIFGSMVYVLGVKDTVSLIQVFSPLVVGGYGLIFLINIFASKRRRPLFGVRVEHINRITDGARRDHPEP